MLSNKYGDNLGWYYLGRAAEGKGLGDAAVRYYGISWERSKRFVMSCLSIACAGINVPVMLEDRLIAVESRRMAGKFFMPPDMSP